MEAIRIVHLERAASEAVCGDVKIETTTDPELVTCRRCRARIEELAAEIVVEPFVPSGPYVPPPGTSMLDEEGVGITAITRSIAGEDLRDGPRWSSLEKMADHCARVLDDGTPIRSSFREEAPVQQSTASDAGMAGRESVLAFRRALDTAFDRPRIVRDVVLSPDRCRAILEAMLCGVPEVSRVAPARKGTITRRAPITAAELATRISAEIGARVTDHEIGMIAHAGKRAMRAALERAGELRPQRRREERAREEEEMGRRDVPGFDLQGWVDISLAAALHQATCRKLAERKDDPLPVHDYFGRPVAIRAEVEAWIVRNAKKRAAAGG